MKITNKEVLEKFTHFINSISSEDKVCVLHDTDMDGMTAGVLAKKGLQELRIEPAIVTPLYHGERSITLDFAQRLIDNGITVLIAVDIPLESYEGIELLSELRVMVIDHHPIEKEYSGITVIKPQLMELDLDPSRICAANLVYNLFNSVIDMEEWDWLTALGIMADSTYSTEKDFVDMVLVKNGNKVLDDVFATDFARAVSYGTYADCVGGADAYDKLFAALDTSSDYKAVISKLTEFASVEKEVNKLLRDFDKKKEELDNDLVFYEITAKYRVNSIVSTILSHKRVPDKTLVVAEKRDDDYKISGRRQDMKVHVGDMFRSCVKGLEDSNGGGHRPASGGRVLKKDYETFKKRAIEWVKNNG